MDIELRVQRALAKGHVMEAILHSRGRWEVGLADLMVLGRRVVTSTEVAIEADFPAHCWLGTQPTTLTLFHEGVMVAAREVRHPGDGSFGLSWSYSIEVESRAA